MKHGSVSPQQTPTTSSWSHSPHPPHLCSPYEWPRDPGLHSGRTPDHTLHQTSDGWTADWRAPESDQERCPSAPTSHRASVGSTQALSGSAPVDSFIPTSGIHPTPIPRYTRLWTQQVSSLIPGSPGSLAQASVILSLPLSVFRLRGRVVTFQAPSLGHPCPAGLLESVHTYGELRVHSAALHYWSQSPFPPQQAAPPGEPWIWSPHTCAIS